MCSAEATATDSPPLCESHAAALDDESPEPDSDSDAGETRAPQLWNGVDLGTVARDTYPPALHEREQWMGRLAGEKLPFAPWGPHDHPEADDDADPRYKWGLSENYVTGDEVAAAEADPRLAGRVFLQQDDDPFVFVDGDDVRCPETGELHPAFVRILNQLGASYTDVSTSGAGVHTYYIGDLPGDQGQAVFEIDDEPFGVNDSRPTVEIYGNTHVCVTTGDALADAPGDLREWDSDAVGAVLDEYDARKDNEPTLTHDTDRDRPALDDHDPTATDADETTGDIRDVLTAVDRLEPRDLPLRTRQTGTDSTGWSTWNPSYRSSDSGTSLHYNGEGAFHDHKLNRAFGVLSLFAAEQGILSNPWDRLAGDDWHDAVDAARDAGASIPEFDASEAAEPVTVLPPAVRDLSPATSGWDWRNTATTDNTTMSTDTARERTSDAIADAYTSGDRVLVEALPTTGKSFGAVKAAAETNEPVTLLTGRGRKEQYEQFREWCERVGLDHYTLPAFFHDCPTASGQFGDEWRDTVAAWYKRGASPKTIHKAAEAVLGQSLPCHEDGACPLSRKWDFDPDDYDVLIGHYNHAHRKTVTSGRTVVFDEFPAAFSESVAADGETTLQAAVSEWLDRNPAVPYDDHTDLVENRDDDERRSDALLWFENNGVERDESAVLDDPDAHADAALAVFAVLAGDDLGNGWERAVLPDGDTRVARNRRTGQVSAVKPPELTYASGVVALDGTPTQRLWELSLGKRLNHRQVLSDAERREYIRDGLNLNLVRTSEYVKPYNSSDHVAVDQDTALLEGIHEQHDEKPSVITTATAEAEYEDSDAAAHVDDSRHFGNVLGSNELRDKRVGAVIGSNHYGDDYLKKWGAVAGEAVARNDEKGADLSYGPFGDDVLAHMRENETLQAAMRFGRDGNGAVVYVHTDTLPEWVPVAAEGRVRRTWSDGMREVLIEAQHREEFSTREIADAVDLSARQVRDHLHTLVEDGFLAAEYDGSGYVWRDDGLHRVNENGAVELEPVDTDELGAGESAELARSSTHTWDFREHDDTPAKETVGPTTAADDTTTTQPESGTSAVTPPD